MMIKTGPKGAKLLKAIHIFCITLWIGGLLTWLPLINALSLEDRSATYVTYQNLRAIAWNVIGWGGISSFISGLLNALFTSWSFKHTWIKFKLIATIAMILIGMFYTEQLMLSNIALLEKGDDTILKSDIFLKNHQAIKMAVPLQLIGFFVIVLVSVYKPWMKKTGR